MSAFSFDVLARIFPKAKPEISVRGHMPALDGMRGLAIVLVMICHFSVALKGAVPNGVLGLLQLGRHGVDLFFVLSGFLITGILIDAKTKPRYFLNFYGRRSVRIFPLYYATLLVIFVLLPAMGYLMDATSQALAGKQASLWLYFSNVQMALEPTTWTYTSASVEMNHFWSLAVEEQFYLVWPLIVYLLPVRQLMWTALTMVAVAVAARPVMMGMGFTAQSIFVFTITRLDALGVGALIAVVARDPDLTGRLTTWARKVGIGCIFGLLGALVILQSRSEMAFHTVKGLLLAGLFGGILVMALSVEGTPAKNFFGGKVLRFCGKYSYGMYVFHLVFAHQFKHFFGPEVLARTLHVSALAAGVLFMALATACTIVMALVSWQVLEKPCLSLKRFFETPAKKDVNVETEVRKAA